MKKLGFVILLCGFVKISISQNIAFKRIPLVVENSQVDSILEAFKLFHSTSIYKDDSCLLFDIEKGYNRNVYKLSLSYEDFINGSILVENEYLWNKPNLRYFRFKNYLVFVIGDLGPENLITYSATKKTLKIRFVKSGQNQGINARDLCTMFYRYENGKFVNKSNSGY